MHGPAQRGAAPRSPTVRRAALIDRLTARFDARLTTIVGGAGAGKTTLLAQMLRSDEEGLDVWCPCGIDDRDEDRLVGHLVERCAEALDEHRPARDRSTRSTNSSSPLHRGRCASCSTTSTSSTPAPHSNRSSTLCRPTATCC